MLRMRATSLDFHTARCLTAAVGLFWRLKRSTPNPYLYITLF